MRSFEIPKINISMFEAENVVTLASGTIPTTNEKAAQDALVAQITGDPQASAEEQAAAASKIFTFAY